MEIYCLKNCGGKAPASNVLFKWQDSSGFWWQVEKCSESEMKHGERFIYYHKGIGANMDTFDMFCKMQWIDVIDGEPDNYEFWDKGRVGWGQFNIRRIKLV